MKKCLSARSRITRMALVAVVIAVAFQTSSSANHSWNGYHWARQSNPFTINLGDNLSAAWKSYLSQTSGDWSTSAVLDTSVVAGKSKNKRCSATSGRVEVCNGTYGQNGWLGVAQIWLASGTKHITQGTVKVNDTYFSMPRYNNKSEREHVLCQEVGHTLGLDHQDESGTSLNTCMDYYFNTSDTDANSTSPNPHDYEELVAVYSHTDSTTTIGSTAATLPDAVPSWAPASQLAPSIYVDALPNGDTLVTYVFWANPIHSRF